MRVPLTVNDFLERAELVYGDRIGIVDEPDQPAEPWGSLTYREIARGARAQAAALDAMGLERGARRDRVAQLGPAHDVVLRCERMGPHPRADQLPAQRRGDRLHRRALRRRGAARRSRARRRARRRRREATARARRASRPRPLPLRRRARAVDADEDATATINYTSGTTARPKGVELTHRTIWLNATIFGWQAGVSDRDVYLHTLPMFHCNGWGMPYGVTGMGGRHIVLRKVDGAEILRRIDEHGVTLLNGAPAVVAAILDAAANWDGEVPGRGRTRMIVAGAAAADADDRAGRDRARLGVHPDLRPHRDRPVAHDESRREEYDALTPGARVAPRSRGRTVARHAVARRRRGRSARAEQRRHGGLLGAAGRDRGGVARRLLPHRRRRVHRRRELPHDRRPQEGRDHLGWRERVVDRGRRLHLLAPASPRSR